MGNIPPENGSNTSRAVHKKSNRLLVMVLGSIALVILIAWAFVYLNSSNARAAEESQSYWNGVSPISIIDISKAFYVPDNLSTNAVSFSVQNKGANDITIIKIFGKYNSASGYYNSGTEKYEGINIHLAPGEKACFGNANIPAEGCAEHTIEFYAGKLQRNSDIGLKADATCLADGSGILQVSSFGFEYIEYAGGASITNRLIGSIPFIASCAKAA